MKKMSLVGALGWALMFFTIFMAEKTAFAEPEPFGIQKFKEKKPAPLFSMEDLEGRKISLADFLGKPALITFWATH